MNCRCQGCDKTWSPDQLQEIKDLGNRVFAGEPMPAGECPDCGAVCHGVQSYSFTNNDGDRRFEVEDVSEPHAALRILHRLGWGRNEPEV